MNETLLYGVIFPCGGLIIGNLLGIIIIKLKDGWTNG